MRLVQDAIERGAVESQDGASAVHFLPAGPNSEDSDVELQADEAVVSIGTTVLNSARVATALHMGKLARRWAGRVRP